MTRPPAPHAGLAWGLAIAALLVSLWVVAGALWEDGTAPAPTVTVQEAVR